MKAVQTTPCRRLRNGNLEPVDVGVIVEKELAIFVNGVPLVTVSLVPDMEKEFTTGYLFSQGFVDDVSGIESIEVAQDSVRVVIKEKRDKSPEEGISYRVVSGGGKMAVSAKTEFSPLHSDLKVRKADVFKAINGLFEAAEIYKQTEGTHAAGLFAADGTPVCIAEDIGRHNTLDKVIGYGLLHGVDFGRVFLAATGRMASEMISKICRAGIPIVATKTAVTEAGLATARQCGVTVIGFVRDAGNRINTDMEVKIVKDAGMKVYTGPERILL
jgi:FdhD protein